MFFTTFILATTAVLVLSQPNDITCEKGTKCNKTIPIPSFDNMKAWLKTDVSKMNEFLDIYVKQNLNKEFKTVMNEMVKYVVKNETTEAESRIQKSLEQIQKEVEKKIEKDKKETEKKLMEIEISMKNQIKNVIINEIRVAETRIQGRLETIQRGVVSSNVELLRDTIKNETEKHFQARQQYAFFATLSSNKQNMKENEVVVFDVVPLNIGGSYNGTTGKFTCKQDGVYTFSWTTVSDPKKDFTSILTVNGNVNVGSNPVDNDATEDHLSGSRTVIVRLKSRDQVWLKVYGSDGDYLRAEWNSFPSSVFSGFKIN